jgi:hypothetical protein
MSVGGTLAASGSGLTDLNASNFSSGTLADARLSGNVALLNTAQTFIGSKTFGNASFFPAPPSFTAGGSPFFVSSTTKVTSLNADLLDGLNSTAFLQSVPVPLTMSGNSATHIIRAENISTTGNTLGGIFENRSTGGSGVYGLVTATTGTTNGVVGQSHSISGRGVYGGALATTGANYGVFGRSLSTSGRGVYGLASASTGLAYGVYGESQSTSGRGVYGLAIETTGITYGVAGESQSTSGYGVYGLAAATSGTGFGVYGNSRGTSGRGVFGRAEATTGSAYGVYGLTFSTSGRGVYGRASASSGLTYGVSGHIVSTSGAGVEGFAAATSGSTYGVWGLNHSTSGSGVYGLADASTGTTYGVRSEVNSPDGYAGYFTGGRNYFQNNVGIGTTTPTELLHVNGRIRVATLGSANTTTVLCRNTAQQIATCNSSSRRYKFNIDDLGSGLDLVRRLRPVAYNWIAGGARDVGLVAEEVAEAEPLLATYNDNGEVEGVKYDRVAVVLINAVREQQSMIDAQRKTIADQQAEIDTLKQRTDAMQKALCALTNEAALCEGVN